MAEVVNSVRLNLHNQRSALKPGFNGRNNHFYSSSFLRF